MTKKRIAILIIAPILLTGMAMTIISTKQFKSAYATWKKQRKQARAAAEEAYFQERVEGFFPEKWRANSWVQVEHGGWCIHTQCKWISSGNRIIGVDHFGRRFDEINLVMCSAVGNQALEDALNIIVRDKVWEQRDIIPSLILPDTTESTVTFQVGPHSGKFKFIELPRENLKLRQLLYKLRMWQADVESRTPSSTLGENPVDD